ncbi:hypothetical protein PHMEG_00036775 [Phytophthora megakarya]|uniref:ZSWIM1/3 RNaseH-like domain-containing protein n=1 Tax=Phytophthora megakarya TaxID=4795 RepID=A0A225UL32_9STRA|nr:hypothetical protein PHMEG_00036775 [Phytophthora megakarya]
MKPNVVECITVLLIDATHDTNAAKYKLFSFMIHDSGCSSFDNVAIIMIDKDFMELSVLKEEFTNARILLCHFHVVKYLQEEEINAKYDLNA